jgi:hypothetical protein
MTLCSPSPLRLRPLEISEDVRATLMLLGLEYVWDSTNNVYYIWPKAMLLHACPVWEHTQYARWETTLAKIADELMKRSKLTTAPHA